MSGIEARAIVASNRVGSASAAAIRAGIASRSFRAPSRRRRWSALRTSSDVVLQERRGPWKSRRCRRSSPRASAAPRRGPSASGLASIATTAGTADLALNRPSEPRTARAWRSAGRPGSRKRSTRALDRRRRSRSSRCSPAKRPRGPTGTPSRRASRRSGAAAPPCRPSRRTRRQSPRERRQRARSRTACGGWADASRSVRLLHGGDGREPDVGVGVGQCVADHAEDERRPLPVDDLRRGLTLRGARSPPVAVPGLGLVVDLRER